MKKLLMLFALVSLVQLQAANANENNEEARVTMKEFISSHYSMLTLPKEGKKKFYTYCSSAQLSFIIGYESGVCVGMSLDSEGKIDYVPTRLRTWKVSWGAGLGAEDGSLHQVKGIKKLEDINGYYLIASSGAGFVASLRAHWFTIKLTLEDLAGNTPELDGGLPVLNAGLDIISLGIMQYKKMPGTQIQIMKLSSKQLNRLQRNY